MSAVRYRSETDKYRKDLLAFCEGNGVDIGAGGDPIKLSAITIDYSAGCMAYCGDHPLQLDGDARSLVWFRNNVLDYVYSSHCLEDFENTKDVLLEWFRVLKAGGKLVLLLPDQRRYEQECQRRGEIPNPAHKIADFGLSYIKGIIEEIPDAEIVFERDIANDYNFEVVIRKLRDTPDTDMERMRQTCESYRLFAEAVRKSRTFRLLKRLGRLKGI